MNKSRVANFINNRLLVWLFVILLVPSALAFKGMASIATAMLFVLVSAVVHQWEHGRPITEIIFSPRSRAVQEAFFSKASTDEFIRAFWAPPFQTPYGLPVLIYVAFSVYLLCVGVVYFNFKVYFVMWAKLWQPYLRFVSNNIPHLNEYYAKWSIIHREDVGLLTSHVITVAVLISVGSLFFQIKNSCYFWMKNEKQIKINFTILNIKEKNYKMLYVVIFYGIFCFLVSGSFFYIADFSPYNMKFDLISWELFQFFIIHTVAFMLMASFNGFSFLSFNTAAYILLYKLYFEVKKG